MGASIQIYTDELCTIELGKDAGEYLVQVGSVDGLIS